jgi:hypothetical protein
MAGEKAFALDKAHPNQGEYVTFPGVPGRYLGSQAVPLSQLGVSLEEMRAMVKETGVPLKETTGPELSDSALYGEDQARFETSIRPGLPRDVGRYPGLTSAESDARDAEKAEQAKLPEGVEPGMLPREAGETTAEATARAAAASTSLDDAAELLEGDES